MSTIHCLGCGQETVLTDDTNHATHAFCTEHECQEKAWLDVTDSELMTALIV